MKQSKHAILKILKLKDLPISKLSNLPKLDRYIVSLSLLSSGKHSVTTELQ